MNFQILNKEFEVNLNKLDKSQADAVRSEAPEVVIRASAGSGKALKHGTKVLTLSGWKNIEDLSLTDKVAGSDGEFYSILGIYPQGKKQIYRILFSDESIIECCKDHLWTWQTSDQRLRTHKWNTNTTEELATRNLKTSNGHWNVYLPMTEPINFPEQPIPLDPYLLGCLLGDGNLSGRGIVFTVAENDLKEHIETILKDKYNAQLNYISQYDYSISGPKGFGYHQVQDEIGAAIDALGLRGTNSHTKFIPDIYKYNSPEIRLEVLKGLIDTDGFCDKSAYDVCLASKQLILDIKWLCESLGFTATYCEKEHVVCNNGSNGAKDCGTFYRLYIKTSSQYPKIHTTKNKDSRWAKGQSSARRTIRKIEKLDEFAEMTCIEVDSPNHLFIIENCIVTHNTSTLITAIADYRYEHINDRICAITYTRAAKAEMEQRLKEMGIYDVEVTTIHVWARNMLEFFADRYDFQIKILTEAQIKDILKDIVAQYLVRSRIKSVNINILYSYITGSKAMDITDNYRRTLNALEARYIQYKKDNRLYDFTDYPQYLWDVLVTFNESINTIDALFVDEFQDVDPVQFDTFKKVNASKKFFIGDPWQSIFQFRNADGEAFDKLDTFEKFKLKYNYRSYQEIINYATTVYNELYEFAINQEECYISQVDFCDISDVICNRGYGGEVTIISPYGKTCRINDTTFTAMGYNRDKYAMEQMIKKNPMILCRTNKEVRTIQEFGFTNVTTVHQAKGLEYDNVIIIDHTISSEEDLNIAYVALTRARDNMLIVNFSQFEIFLNNR